MGRALLGMVTAAQCSVLYPGVADQKKLWPRIAFTIPYVLAMNVMRRRGSAKELRLNEAETRWSSVEERTSRQALLNDQVRAFNVRGSLKHPESVHQEGAGPRFGDNSVLLTN